ncbi:branched-chain amino acid ABC transporter permease [[Clostridium] symbiosum]|uniref:branched-chain amino acid ABC transporter permease n=1 Tax=Clostridium symbiosum TaxID=1512 RepID=UPI001D08032B|nr:branched-chain amino acid ABC transporter permease [[Clostridium] symbiosum]MCB6611607.1 branched-chain amino acid ABC transporter permease [[Clostridium] symbiosum]MCB6932692.1 branched-chain amino acid ABC transporter permease [[Clostridium] symbiosum]
MSYIITVAVNIAIFALLALSLNIITGYAGQSAMGHAAFFGIGAYASALMTNAGINFWLTLPAALLITGAAGGVLGIISLRLKDDFLAITTIGINFVMVALFQNMEIFGASLGMSVKTPTFFGQKMTPLHFLVLLVILIVIVCLLIRKMTRSWFGLALSSIRNDEGAAMSLGINVNRYKILAFFLGTSIAGLTGAIYVHRMTFIFSSSFAFTVSISILSMVVVGGIGTIRGPLLGALILGAAPELLRFADNYRMILYGGILVLMMRFQPQGLLGNDSFIVRNFLKIVRGHKAGETNG